MLYVVLRQLNHALLAALKYTEYKVEVIGIKGSHILYFMEFLFREF